MKDGYRHGDVIIINSEIPKDATRVKNRPLALGEITGHSHRVTKGEFELYEKEGVVYMRVVSETADLVHEEHDTIKLPQGEYEVHRQREYEPKGWRHIQD